MAPVSEADLQRVKSLLTEAVTVLCKDSLHYSDQLTIEGLLGITVDKQDIFLVNMNETVLADISNKGGRKGKAGKATKRNAPAASPSAGKRGGKPTKPKRRRKDHQVSPLMIRPPPIGSLTIKQEDNVVYHGYNDQMSLGYDVADYDLAPKKQARKKKKSTPNPEKDMVLTAETMVSVQRTILEQEGCVVLSRILQRRKNKFRASALIQAMKDMSRSQSDRHYVGEYKEIGNIKLFYKCPPELLHADALVAYEISPDEYTNLFYNDFKPNSGCPTDWASYVATLLANTPYNPMLFPVDSMGLGADEKKMLTTKQLERQSIFQQATVTDSEGHEEEEEEEEEVEEEEVGDGVEALSEEVIDTPGVALSLTIPASGSAEAVVGDLSHELHVSTSVHGQDPAAAAALEAAVHGGCHHHPGVVDHLGATVDCHHETIETETVVDDSLVMHDEQDYGDSPS